MVGEVGVNPLDHGCIVHSISVNVAASVHLDDHCSLFIDHFSRIGEELFISIFPMLSFHAVAK